MSTQRRISLSFRNPELEQQYRSANRQRLRTEGRMAMLVGSLVYLLCGVLDSWFVPEASRALIWQIRFGILTVPVFFLLLSLTPWFDRYAQLWLAMVSLAAGLGIIAMQSQLPQASSSFYYPMMVLVTFYTYNFVGIRFIYALGVDLFLLGCYNLVFGVQLGYPLEIMLAHDIFIVSANLIGGAAGYLAEWHKRTLFLQKCELLAERQFHYQRARHDGLTGLPNRELLYERIGQALARSQRDGSVHAGLFLDLDGFKGVNDSLGHAVGDEVLKALAGRLRASVREVDCVARIGGDEFFVLAVDVGSRESADRLARKLLALVRQPLPGVPSSLPLSVSIGICLFAQEGYSASDVVNNADQAMYQVKSGGKNDYCFAEPAVPVKRTIPAALFNSDVD